MEEREREQVRISVRNLVEFILRSGDLDNRKDKTPDKNAMQAGAKMHRKIQKRMGAEYHAEVPLRIILEEERYELVVEGRADGIIYGSCRSDGTNRGTPRAGNVLCLHLCGAA